MELTAKIAALEEEITVLKGEIKAILLEVRTAVLARENPFAIVAIEPLPAVPVRHEPSPSVAQEPVANAVKPIESPAAREPHLRLAPPAQPDAGYEEPVPSRRLRASTSQRRWGVQTLAALMTWTQETAERFTTPDLGIVLSLARYGGLIETDLEATLAKVGRTLVREDDQKRASVNDFLLALRQLDALLRDENEEKSTGHSVRLAG